MLEIIAILSFVLIFMWTKDIRVVSSFQDL